MSVEGRTGISRSSSHQCLPAARWISGQCPSNKKAIMHLHFYTLRMSMSSACFSGIDFCCPVALLCCTEGMQGTAVPEAQLIMLDKLCILPAVAVCCSIYFVNSAPRADIPHIHCMDALPVWRAKLDKLDILLVVGLCVATCSLCTSQNAVHRHRQYMDASPLWGAMLDKLGIQLVVGLCGATCSVCTPPRVVHCNKQHMGARRQVLMLHK